jgi:CII-binding regulator of phage lambda lysogenization HflD
MSIAKEILRLEKEINKSIEKFEKLGKQAKALQEKKRLLEEEYEAKMRDMASIAHEMLSVDGIVQTFNPKYVELFRELRKEYPKNEQRSD